MRKKIISLCMIFILAGNLLTLPGCGSSEAVAEAEEDGQEQEILTNAQWITGLGGTFGMTDYTTEEPFFSDVPVTEEVFPYVQSCAEWGIFKYTGGSFLPEENATREFAVQTAVMAAEVLDETDGSAYDACIPYALQNGILESDDASYLSENLTYAQGQEILDWALNEYQNRTFEEYQDVAYNADLMDFTDCAAISVSSDGNTVIPAGEAEILEEGDVFVAPGTLEYPEGIAQKVKSVTVDNDGNQIVETTEPTLEEIYEKMDFAVSVAPEPKDIIVYNGVTVADAEKGSAVYASCEVLSDKRKAQPYAQKKGSGFSPVSSGSSFTFNIGFKNGSPTVSGKWQESFDHFKQDISVSLGSQDAASLFEKSNTLYQNDKKGNRKIDKISNKFSGGYEITGSVMVEDFSVEAEAETKKTLGVPTGIKSFFVRANCKITTALKAKGEIKEELKIASVPIATPVPGLTVNVDFVLFANANGELEIKVVTNSSTSFTYADGNYKKTSSTNMDSASFEGGITIEFGPKVKVTPSVLGIEIIDANIKLAMKLDFSSVLTFEDREEEIDQGIQTVRAWMWNVEGTATAPIVALGVGTSSKCLLKLNLEWTLVKGKTWNLFGPKHYDIGEDILEVKAKEGSETGNEMESEQKGGGTETPGILDIEMLNIDTYTLGLEKGQSKVITVTDIPEGYSASDLRWECDNPSVAAVKAGNVTAVGAGTAIVTVSTSDGKYQVSCTIFVSNDETVEFEAL